MLSTALLACGLFLFPLVLQAREAPKPKLILQITVDQLRGDLPTRFMKHMGKGGFRYLQEQGVWYSNAHYSHANTETVVGHTTLATGANPSEHGMVANVWFDRETNKLAYNIEDARYHVLTEGADVDKSTEVDTTQKMASSDGRSPANILVTTFSDELSLASNGAARVFGVSVKDRGAVTMSGHAGKAFWFSKSTGGFISSSYYYEHYPAWVNAWNQKKLAQAYSGKAWKLLLDKSNYLFGKGDDKDWEMDIVGFGKTFPHRFGKGSGKYFNTYLTFSPVGDELTLEFAKALIEAEDIGKDEITDYLSISFSSTDYVGHIFGPSSLEMEDNLLRLDRTLAKLFSYIDKNIGLEHTLIVLSADHGGPEAPGYNRKYGIDSGYVSPEHWDRQSAIIALKKKFGIGQQLIKKFYPPYLYLNHEAIQEKGLDLEEVEQAVAQEIMKIKGVALAVSSAALRNNALPDSFLNRAALNNFHPKRSGDLLILFQPQYFINDYGGEIMAANHGGPWEYDTYVPVVFAGMSIKGQHISRAVEPKDIALTLTGIMGIKPPSGASGTMLREVVGQSENKP
ncbi:alkaline phosphatase [Thiolapillus brandeum]|uniref:Alkaline phosphatase n=1 Tax=Thiolapillus brandeum TaxID=1076588 RepID=A0A7U6GJP4_9GAMM|nr:alkaline phosphatase [Thiolapillus brandeum]